MHFQDAVEWVNDHSGVIKAKAKRYCLFTPYEPIDFMQTAYEAAIISVMRCQKNPNLVFHGVFWKVFYTMVRDMTPFERSGRRGSQSVPSFLVQPLDAVDSFDVPLTFCDVTEEVIPIIFENVSKLLSKRQRHVMSLWLGLDGVALHVEEIAVCLSCCRRNVEKIIQRALNRIERGGYKELLLPILNNKVCQSNFGLAS